MRDYKPFVRRLAGPTVCAVLGIWMLAFWIQTAVDLRAQYLGYPVADNWGAAEKLSLFEKAGLGILWEQHNEHRVVFTELTNLVDGKWFGAHEYLPLILSTLFQAATFAMFGWVIWRDRNLSASLRLGAIFLGGIMLGWPGISYVLSFPFLIQWTVVQFLAIAALLALKCGRLGVAIGCAILATFSSGHGMLLWPVLLLCGVILGIGWKRLTAVFIAATLSVTAYFYHLVPSAAATDHTFLHEPTWFFGFLASMLSMPFGADRRILGLWLGPASFLLFAVILFLAWRRRLLSETPSIILFGTLIFSLLTVLACGFGRTLATYWDYPTAKVARYLSVPVCYWAALLLVTVWVLGRMRDTAPAAWIALAIMALGLAYQFPRVQPWLDRQFDFYSRTQNVSLAMESGVTCDNLIERDSYPVPAMVHTWDPILRGRRLSIYANDRFQWTGRPVASLMSIRPEDSAKGAVTESIQFACAEQLAGWLNGDERELLLVNEKGIIAGLARRLPAGLPLYLPKVWSHATPKENWTGFVNYAIPSESVRPYVILADGRTTVPIGAAIPVVRP